LHDFAREVKLTEDEFRQACAFIAELGKKTNETHNEVRFCCAGHSVFSTLVCLLNNGDKGQTETTAKPAGALLAHEFPTHR
jgi:catechol 1,2-dioxygenase